MNNVNNVYVKFNTDIKYNKNIKHNIYYIYNNLCTDIYMIYIIC